MVCHGDDGGYRPVQVGFKLEGTTMARILSTLLAFTSVLAAPPTPCIPRCTCTPTTYTCRFLNITAFPVDTFTGWEALQSIDLQGNKATALPSGLFTNLPALTSLSLNYVGPLTSLPAGLFAGLGSLASLGLAGLPLSVPFDAATMVGALPALTALYLGGGTLLGGGGACPDLSPLAALTPRLATLSAVGPSAMRGLTSIPPRSFAGLKLATLDLSYSNLNLTNHAFDGLQVGEVKVEWSAISLIEPDAFTGLTARNVDLYFNSIGFASIPVGGLAMAGVSALCLAGNPLDARIFARPLFASAPRLTGLDLMGGMGLGPWIGELPARAFANAPALTTLQLFNSGITGFAEGAFEGLPNLVSLNIGFNLGFSVVPAGLFDPLPALTTLVINNGGLAGDSALRADAFKHNPELAVLDLSWNTGISSLPPGLLAGSDKLATIDMTFQGAGNLYLAPGTFSGINASGALQGNVSITLIRNQMTNFSGFTSEPEIVAAICAEARAWPGTCTVVWAPQEQDPPGGE